MTRTELLHAALKKLTEAVKLLDNSGEELLADDALELAERVNLSICTGAERTKLPSAVYLLCLNGHGRQLLRGICVVKSEAAKAHRVRFFLSLLPYYSLCNGCARLLRLPRGQWY